MSTNQRRRLFVASKDLAKALAREDLEDDTLLPVLGALRFELTAAYKALAMKNVDAEESAQRIHLQARRPIAA